MAGTLFYVATSREEYSRLEKAMSNFLNSYIISSECNLEISKGWENCIKVHPYNGLINEVIQRKGEKVSKGVLARLTPQHKFARISLDGIVFQIDFDSKVA